MSKRTATEVQFASSSNSDEHRKAHRASGSKLEKTHDEEMGEFEDGWEDEFESDEEVVDAEAGNEEGAPQIDSVNKSDDIDIVQRHGSRRGGSTSN